MSKHDCEQTKPLRLGLDIGSTTVKIVVLQPEGDDTLVYSMYKRHNSDIKRVLIDSFMELRDEYPNETFKWPSPVAWCFGADWLDVPFVQEVIAGTEAIERRHPGTDVIIELGGEDAKITFLTPTTEQRMNGTCAAEPVLLLTRWPNYCKRMLRD